MYSYTGIFAGVGLDFLFAYPDTAKYYGNPLKRVSACGDAIQIPRNDVTGWMDLWKADNPAYAEYVVSCSYVCDRLMENGRVVFHGAAVLRNGLVYLFTGPSGAGKTTQARLWKSVFGESSDILNGDKPILQINNADKVLVHPSPWKGKEGYGRDDIIAPLGGIILLRQASENMIRLLAPEEAARELFCRIYSTFSTEKDVRSAARILETILVKTPVWLLRNKGDKASALMTWKELQNGGSEICHTD